MPTGRSCPPLGQKLKPGPGLDPTLVAESQSYRLRGAMVELVADEGYEQVTVRELSVRAEVSTRSFYKHFRSLDECFLSTHDSVIHEAIERSREAPAEPGAESRIFLQTRVLALLKSLSANPKAARLALIDIYALGPAANSHIIEATAELEALLAATLSALPELTTATPHLVAGIVAGTTRVLRKTTMADRAEELPRLAAELSDWMLALCRPNLRALAASTSGEPVPNWSDPGPSVDPDTPRIDRDDLDRSRILDATIALAGADGYPRLTEARICAHARVSRRAFTLCFRDVRHCFLEAIDALIGSRALGARDWALDIEAWGPRTYKTILALCAWGANDGALSRLVFIETFAAGTTGLLKREDLLGRAAAQFRLTIPEGLTSTEVATEASVAAAWHIACGDVAAGRTGGLQALAPLFTFMLLAPATAAVDASCHMTPSLQPASL